MTDDTDRDAKGRFLPGHSKRITSENAVEMGKRSHQKRGEGTASKLILEAYPGGDAPEYMRALAKQAVSNASAMNAWIKLTAPQTETTTETKTCPFRDNCDIFQYKDGNIPKQHIDAALRRVVTDD